MRVLVLGAHGFLGTHVARAFAATDTVFRAGVANEVSDDYLRIDRERDDLANLLEWAMPDVIINCAGAANVPDSFQHPIRDFQLNTVLTVRILDALRRHTPRTRMINLSSAAVYGNPNVSPIPESAPLRPVSPYGWHKLHAENACVEYCNLFQVPSVSLRIFSAYGPGLRKQLFWDIFQKARGNPQRLELFGTGNETRDFIFVDDLADSIRAVINGANFDGEAINIASGESVNIRIAATTLLQAIGSTSELIFSGAERTGDPAFWQADISKLTSLGFVPNHTFESGIAEVARWMTMSGDE